MRRFISSPLRWLWRSIPSYLPFYLLVILAGYAAWNGWPKRTVISDFHLPPENKDRPLPFSEGTVANVLRDAMTAIIREAQGDNLPEPCGPVATKGGQASASTASAEPASKKAPPVMVTARAAVEVPGQGPPAAEIKGISAQALVALAREVLGRERVITGDVVLVGPDSFQLMARADDVGPWTEGPEGLSLEGLKKASCKLAEKIWEDTDRNLLAAALIHRGDYKRAVALYDTVPSDKQAQAALSSPGVAIRANAYFSLAYELYEKGDHDGSIADYRKAITLKPDNVDAHNNLGFALYEKEDLDGAIAEYRKALDLDPDYDYAHFNLAIALDKKGEHDAAIAEYRKVLALKPANADAHNNLGYALYEKGDFDAGIAEYQKALALNRNDAFFHYNLASALHAAKREQEAKREFQEAHRLDSSLSPPQD